MQLFLQGVYELNRDLNSWDSKTTGTLQTERKSQEIYDQLHCTRFRINATGIMHCTVVEQGQLVYNRTNIRSCRRRQKRKILDIIY